MRIEFPVDLDAEISRNRARNHVFSDFWRFIEFSFQDGQGFLRLAQMFLLGGDYYLWPARCLKFNSWCIREHRNITQADFPNSGSQPPTPSESAKQQVLKSPLKCLCNTWMSVWVKTQNIFVWKQDMYAVFAGSSRNYLQLVYFDWKHNLRMVSVGFN